LINLYNIPTYESIQRQHVCMNLTDNRQTYHPTKISLVLI